MLLRLLIVIAVPIVVITLLSLMRLSWQKHTARLRVEREEAATARFLTALQAIARSLRQTVPKEVIYPIRCDLEGVVLENLRRALGHNKWVQIDMADFIVPRSAAHLVHTHLGEEGCEMQGPTVSGNWRIKKASWLADLPKDANMHFLDALQTIAKLRNQPVPERLIIKAGHGKAEIIQMNLHRALGCPVSVDVPGQKFMVRNDLAPLLLRHLGPQKRRASPKLGWVPMAPWVATIKVK